MSYGEGIAWARQERMMNQSELARQAGVKRRVISEIENGHREPTKAILRDICRALDVDEEDLI